MVFRISNRESGSINRNIVECKVEVYNVADLVRLRINRNIVECKA